MYRRKISQPIMAVYYDGSSVHVLQARPYPEFLVVDRTTISANEFDQYITNRPQKPKKVYLAIPKKMVVERSFETRLENAWDINLYIEQNKAKLFPELNEEILFDFVTVDQGEGTYNVTVYACNKVKINLLLEPMSQARVKPCCVAIDEECIKRYISTQQGYHHFAEFAQGYPYLQQKNWQICMGLLLRDEHVRRHQFTSVAG